MLRAILFEGRYTLCKRCASSMTHRSRERRNLSRFGDGELIRTHDEAVRPIEGIVASGLTLLIEGLRVEHDGGEKELVGSSCCHCFRSVAGTISRMRRRRSAHRWEITNPDSIVLPRPTSSARIAPCESGERRAKSAASTGCGLRSTRAFAMDRVRPLDGSRRTTEREKVSQILGLIGSFCAPWRG